MSAPLRVPLEVLERILSFAFTPLASPSSSSSSATSSNDLLAPPLGTSHLLIVSKGIRQLAIPLYYSTISIVHGTEWSTFLHPENGLLVGEDNEEKASFVKELWIDVDGYARVPMDLEPARRSLENNQGPDRIHIKLERTVLPRLDRLLLFVGGSARSPPGGDWSRLPDPQLTSIEDLWWEVVFGRLVAEWEEGRELEFEKRGAEAWGDEWDDFLEAGLQSILQETDIPRSDDLLDQAVVEREEAWNLFVNPTRPPRRIEITLDGLGKDIVSQLYLLGPLSTSDHPFVILPPTGLDFGTDEDERTGVNDVRQNLERLSFASSHFLVFEGFPRSFWESTRDGSEIVWGEGWTWRQEDGTVMGLKETFGGDAVELLDLLVASFLLSYGRHYHIYPQKSLSQSINNVFGGIHLSFHPTTPSDPGHHL
ncbi:hypothetical protein BDY24DRAFT_441360 [Mrakia frigida]|uniref:uncharacterized protein n=1 Tax=Mrakia frigida TaxID=29902 RepID=UPI003FCC1515